MSQLLFDIVDTSILKENSKIYLNKSFEYFSKSLIENKTFIKKGLLEDIYKHASAEAIKENSLAWFGLSILKALHQEGNIDILNQGFVEDVLTDLLTNENKLDLDIWHQKTAKFNYAIPINLTEKLKFNFEGWQAFRHYEEYQKWKSTLAKSVDLISSINPLILDDLNILIENVLTVYSKNGSHGSMSPKNITGTIYLPDINDYTLLAECLVHEALHQYLYRLEHSSSLFTENDGNQELYYSPWKDEPRPLIMVLHGAFVFTGVILFYQSLCDMNTLPKKHQLFRERLSHRFAQVNTAIDVLNHNDKFTSFGRSILNIMREYLSDVKEHIVLSSDLEDIVAHKNRFSKSNYVHVSI